MVSVTVHICAFLMIASHVCAQDFEAVCEESTCPPTATCRQYPTYVSCECPYGKTGPDCTLNDPCLQRKDNCPNGTLCFGECNPNVVCNGADGIPQCLGCVAGWTASDCRTDIDECEYSPSVCLNNGVCTNLEGDYKCNCPTGWVGKDCFCKKGTSCDSQGVQKLDQYTGITEDNEYTKKDDNNSAESLAFCRSLFLHMCFICPFLLGLL